MTKEFIERNLLSYTGRLKRKKLNEFNLSEEMAYINFHNIEKPTCNNKGCNNKVIFKSFSKGFGKYCCKECQNMGSKNYTNNKLKMMKKEAITKEYISSILDKNGKPNANITRFLPLSVEELFLVYNNIEKPICKNRDCDNFSGFKNFSEGYYDFCSVKCVQNNKKVRQKIEDTLFSNYGTRDPFEIKDGRKKGIAYITSEENFRKQQINNEKKFGGKTSFSSSKVQDKCKETIYEKYGVDNPGKSDKIKEKIRFTNEKNCYWITEDQVNDFKSYTKLVWRYTNNNNLSVLENIDKRAHTKEGYHLDHKYSIYQGFIDGIDAKIIGNICNLEMLQSGQNLSKNRKCSITKEDLLSSYTV